MWVLDGNVIIIDLILELVIRKSKFIIEERN